MTGHRRGTVAWYAARLADLHQELEVERTRARLVEEARADGAVSRAELRELRQQCRALTRAVRVERAARVEAQAQLADDTRRAAQAQLADARRATAWRRAALVLGLALAVARGWAA